MSFYENIGGLREIGRKIVLPSAEMKNIIHREIFNNENIKNVIDFGAGTLYWSILLFSSL